jgi:hypothetical protein
MINENYILLYNKCEMHSLYIPYHILYTRYTPSVLLYTFHNYKLTGIINF